MGREVDLAKGLDTGSGGHMQVMDAAAPAGSMLLTPVALTGVDFIPSGYSVSCELDLPASVTVMPTPRPPDNDPITETSAL